MADKLGTYRSKRSSDRTPEPVPDEGPLPSGGDDTFVIQEHHARALHWDFRLERGGVLVSWALPKGLPQNTKRNHLAVQTEDHPLEYAAFAGEIPKGEYGGGSVTIWDRGTYDCETWTEDEVKVVLHGTRASGRFALIHTGERNWLIHRMADPPTGTSTGTSAGRPAAEPAGSGRAPMPGLIRPMLATLSSLPESDDAYAYETKWDGVRAIAYVHDERVRLLTRNDADVTAAYPELAGLGAALGPIDAIFDGEIIARDRAGRVSFGLLQPRMHLREARQIARLVEQTPVSYEIFDLLFLDGHSTMDLPYRQRRELLDGLGLSGLHWATTPYTVGGGAAALAKAVAEQTEGVVAKRVDSRYLPGKRGPAWLKIKNFRTQEVVVGGWRGGQGARAGTIGSLLLGIPGPSGLEYVGQVGTGFTRDTLAQLHELLAARARRTSPFAGGVPARDSKDAHWVSPKLVGEVAFAEWTRDGRLRHPSWRGLRPDKAAGEVVRESA